MNTQEHVELLKRIEALEKRVRQLEERRKPGRPPKHG